MRENLIPCSFCGALHPAEELTVFGDSLLCESCVATETVHCRHCGERILREDNCGEAEYPLCSTCYDRHYTVCYDCGRLLRHEDAHYENDDSYDARCYDCHCRHMDTRGIHDYCYKPEPEFYGDGSRFFGVELEIDNGGESNRKADEIIRAANAAAEHIYCKHDGSLNDGFEIVTHPTTLRYHLDTMPWAAVLTRAKSLAYVSHRAGTCGLHIRVNRSAFGNSLREQEEVIDRICDVAIAFTDEELKAMSWTTFVAGCSHMPELVQYLKERRLYVNEPVSAEAEV